MIQKDASWVSPKHLLITVFAGFLFLACACVNTGMTNTVLPAICTLRGWDYADALPYMSYGGYIGAAATLVFTELVVKKGAKFVIILGLILGGLCLALYGCTTAFGVFILCIIGNRVFSCAYQQAGCTTLLNNWFPRKKGVVLGWATMGIILSDIVWSPYIPKIIRSIGPSFAMTIVGGLFLLLALWCAISVKDIPEAAGCFPDNDPTGLQALEASRATAQSYRTSFTCSRLLRTPQVWQIGFYWGLLWMIAVAFVSQLVNRCLSLGYSSGFSIQVLQIASLVALVGSWLFGWFDTKFGTKRATQLYAVSIILCFLLGLFQSVSTAFVWISTCGAMACVGGIANLAPSMVGTVFGRWDFSAANRFISPIIMAVSSSAFVLTSLFLKTPWGYDGLYVTCSIIGLLCLIGVSTTSDQMIGATTKQAVDSTQGA